MPLQFVDINVETSAEPAGSDLERRREIGQFFTPSHVAGFVWELLEIIHGGPFSPHTRLIDPACGEGVFLRVAADRGGIRPACLFGTDIDAQLVEGWRGDPLLSKARLRLANGLLEDPAAGVMRESFDVVAGNPPFSGRGLRNLLRLLNESDANKASREPDLFGAASVQEEPSQPLTREQCLELERLTCQLSQYSCWRLAGESDSPQSPLAASADDLLAGVDFAPTPKTLTTDCERAARLLAGWPPDRRLDTSRAEIRDVIRRLAATAIEVFFTERFVQLTKPGGLIAMIVPEGVVAGDQHAALRTWLSREIDLLASVSLPQKVFTGVGANAKTTIVFARRTPGNADREVLLAAPTASTDLGSLADFFADTLAHARQCAPIFRPV